jgi:hypothetical protein
MNFMKWLFSIMFIYAIMFGVYKLGFIVGYEESENDMIKRSYVFNNTPRAFK